MSTKLEVIQQQTVKWDQITAECDGYRAGFVAVFRKYEGHATDETDAQGRIVKVSQSSFARHVGIPERTFNGWVGQAGGGRPPERDRTLEALRHPEIVDKVISGLDEESFDHLHAAVLARRMDSIEQNGEATRPHRELKAQFSVIDNVDKMIRAAHADLMEAKLSRAALGKIEELRDVLTAVLRRQRELTG